MEQQLAPAQPLQRIDSPRKPDWAIILLGRVQHGEPIENARCRRGSLVSRDTISRYGHMDPDWFTQLMDAQDGIAQGTTVSDLDIARANAYAEEERRHDLAMDAKRDADAISAMRLGKESIGRVGQGAQASASAAVIVRIERPAAYNGEPLTIEGKVVVAKPPSPPDYNEKQHKTPAP